MNFTDILEKLNEYTWQMLVSLLGSWILLRQKYVRDEHNTMKEDIAKLKVDHEVLNTTLDNVQTNQKIIRADVKETNKDVKLLLARSAVKKGWFS